MLLRLAASAAFAVAGGMVGFALADKLRREQRLCAVIGCLLRRAAFLVGYRCDDVYAVCAELKRDSELAPLTFLQSLPESYESGADFRDCWEKAVKSQRYGSEEEAVLLRLGNIIGRSDSASQLDSIRALEVTLGEVEARRRENYLRKGRLYRSVGLLFGVMAGILVI
ncbi:MAG: stage III sporulation protein AB [Ruminococcus sp.]|nr:stage III sporulation protein AB [Ruminococcus sp.]